MIVVKSDLTTVNLSKRKKEKGESSVGTLSSSHPPSPEGLPAGPGTTGVVMCRGRVVAAGQLTFPPSRAHGVVDRPRDREAAVLCCPLVLLCLCTNRGLCECECVVHMQQRARTLGRSGQPRRRPWLCARPRSLLSNGRAGSCGRADSEGDSETWTSQTSGREGALDGMGAWRLALSLDADGRVETLRYGMLRARRDFAASSRLLPGELLRASRANVLTSSYYCITVLICSCLSRRATHSRAEYCREYGENTVFAASGNPTAKTIHRQPRADRPARCFSLSCAASPSLVLLLPLCRSRLPRSWPAPACPQSHPSSVWPCCTPLCSPSALPPRPVRAAD